MVNLPRVLIGCYNHLLAVAETTFVTIVFKMLKRDLIIESIFIVRSLM
jgi:hypothetical protein